MDRHRSSRAAAAIAVLVLAVGAVLATGCGGEEGATSGDRLEVVASFFPLAEAAEQVGGDAVAVTDLTPTGADPHGAELTTAQVDAIEDADLAVVLGGDFQPEIEERADRREGATLTVLDELAIENAAEDPHVWLDPVLMADVVAAVEAALVEADPAHAEQYRAGADRYGAELRVLHDDMEAALGACERTEIVTAHAAFGWLAARYGLEQLAIAGVDPDDEPSAERIGELADEADAAGATTVFAESTSDPALAETLAREAGGLRVATLHTLEARTDEQRAAGLGYVDLMRENQAALAQGLGCS